MGISFKNTMPLLSTLAALVIIVHSAEEDLESDYRYDLGPRVIETATPIYEQPWRAIEVEPIMQQFTPSNLWDDTSPEEPPKRHRAGRKRKRRPQLGVVKDTQDFLVQDTYTYREAEITDTYQTTETSRRRRKRPGVKHNRGNTNPLQPEKPLRRREQKRKQQSYESRPLLSEFSMYQMEKNFYDTNEQAKTEQNETLEREENLNNKDEPVENIFKEEIDSEFQKHDKHNEREGTQENNPRPESDDQFDNIFPNGVKNGKQYSKYALKEDKSLSEFSLEDMNPSPKTIIETDIIQKIEEKSSTPFNTFDNPRNNDPIDPLTLKQILKKSNGTSLSEILQQHNLSLADLLHGRENAVSVLKSDHTLEYQHKTSSVKGFKNIMRKQHPTEKNIAEKENIEGVNLEKQFVMEPVIEFSYTTMSIDPIIDIKTDMNSKKNLEHMETSTLRNQDQKVKENIMYRILPKRRLSVGGRRKLRIKPLVNNTVKDHLNRDLIASSTRKYIYHTNRNITKFIEPKNQIMLMLNISDTTTKVDKKEIIITTTSAPEETTMIHDTENNKSSSVLDFIQRNLNSTESEPMTDIVNTAITTFSTVKTIHTESVINVTEKPKVTPTVRFLVNNSGLRRQAFNNRLKKKRLKQNNSTTEYSQDEAIKDLSGMINLVSASEFITKLQTPTSIKSNKDKEFLNALEDSITTEMTSNINKKQISTKLVTTKDMITTRIPLPLSTTEETAKNEIEEILNDTRSSARLSKILLERNMTLNELVELRERGSSHIHLADIFHNASKEPNPPEPFLSKSLIEPISKETYPLRALLEANLHDPSIKSIPIDSIPTLKNNIPIAMDFGNNVNENGENMGIMSLFNKLIGSDNNTENGMLKKDTKKSSYIISAMSVNLTNTSDSIREGRNINGKGIFALNNNRLENTTKKGTETFINDYSSLEGITRGLKDIDADGLILLEDLQRFKDFDSNIGSTSDEKFEVNLYETVETSTQKSSIFDRIPSSTKSVTVATSSIFGLAMILFLLTYAAFKWKQQRKILCKKDSFCKERIPTPVFENRKGHKHNSSNRSISPMLSSSNIYAINTLEKRSSEGSPDYMWETLRKQF